MSPRFLMIEPRNRRAKDRRVLIIKGSFWSWHCPCCYTTCGGFPRWEDAAWDAHMHISVWHSEKERRTAE